ncbi:MAG: hypothetical protein VB030_05850 [Eubacterium aggregans]|uniref:Uncharacterized protein n=1 Tax=Eubacterium aggregans TaxID=81409 RepID=A0A1H3YXT6_9FIRM|nr:MULTISPECIES: hypothetical protein [Clostridia]MEA5003639.1 hypothetical protein [Christensenella sp.]MEA5073677.1 hypothetical protein [Eubacterium aggregans]SEA16266.1 hypothetical protein SAMN04515656_104157 [Eubacterium aggregans]
MNIDPVLINLICAIAGGLIGYAVYMANTKKDSKQDGAQEGAIASDLGYLKKGIEDINHKLEKQDERYFELVQRLAAVEASAKQAHKRINAIAGTNCPEEREG